MACDDLIGEFEKKLERREVLELITKNSEKAFGPATASGGSSGIEAEEIVGATLLEDQIVFLVKWKNSELRDLVLARVANGRIPDLIIKYYEERLRFFDDP